MSRSKAQAATLAEVEKLYIDMRQTETGKLIATANAGFLIIYGVIGLGLDRVIARPENLWIMTTFRIVTIALALAFFEIDARKPHLSAYWITLLQFLVNANFAYLLHDGFTEGPAARAVIPGVCFMIHALFFLVGSPLRPKQQWLPFCINMLLAILACSSDLERHSKFLGVVAATFVFAIMFQLLLSHWTARAAKNELATRLKVAPHELVRRALVRHEDLEIQLRPQLRWCVCLASDWRGYQQISRTEKPERLAEALTAYYDACRELLETHFPTGNYFSDWIADELLIYFLTEKEPPDAELCAQVITFARSLLEMKEAFAAKLGLPRGIDIGIASGLASIGLSGLASNRKVIAVGDVPVRARKMQGMGKALRTARGDQDRIIYSDALLDEGIQPTGALALAEVVPDAAIPEVIGGEMLLFEEPRASLAKAG